MWALGCAVAVAAASLVAVLGLARRPAPVAAMPLMQMNIDMGFDAVPGARATAVISPDARWLVFQSRTPDGRLRLSLRKMDQTNSVAMEGTEAGVDPFFSPDSKWVGFFAGN